MKNEKPEGFHIPPIKSPNGLPMIGQWLGTTLILHEMKPGIELDTVEKLASILNATVFTTVSFSAVEIPVEEKRVMPKPSNN